MLGRDKWNSGFLYGLDFWMEQVEPEPTPSKLTRSQRNADALIVPADFLRRLAIVDVLAKPMQCKIVELGKLPVSQSLDLEDIDHIAVHTGQLTTVALGFPAMCVNDHFDGLTGFAKRPIATAKLVN